MVGYTFKLSYQSLITSDNTKVTNLVEESRILFIGSAMVRRVQNSNVSKFHGINLCTDPICTK